MKIEYRESQIRARSHVLVRVDFIPYYPEVPELGGDSPECCLPEETVGQERSSQHLNNSDKLPSKVIPSKFIAIGSGDIILFEYEVWCLLPKGKWESVAMLEP